MAQKKPSWVPRYRDTKSRRTLARMNPRSAQVSRSIREVNMRSGNGRIISFAGGSGYGTECVGRGRGAGIAVEAAAARKLGRAGS